MGIVLFYVVVRIKRRLFIYFLLNKGEVVYLDDGASGVIRNSEYRVSARPDRVTNYKGKNYIIEYKSRKKGIYEKDVVQGVVGALAVWGKFDGIDGLVVYNGSYQFKRYSFGSKEACYRRVKKAILKAQKIKSGKTVKEKVETSKCRVCPYNTSCKKSKHR
tara:strand:+ start:68579 stop:69061 length:483 start_codon:yes stop_codon:yes gene_type:complete